MTGFLFGLFTKYSLCVREGLRLILHCDSSKLIQLPQANFTLKRLRVCQRVLLVNGKVRGVTFVDDKMAQEMICSKAAWQIFAER